MVFERTVFLVLLVFCFRLEPSYKFLSFVQFVVFNSITETQSGSRTGDLHRDISLNLVISHLSLIPDDLCG